MSRSVDLFISAPESLDEVAAEVGRLTGKGLAPTGDPGHWLMEDGGVAAVLAAHPYADDGTLALSHYQYALSARVGNSGRPQDSAEAALLRRVAQKLQGGSKWLVLLVLDLQYRDQIARSAQDQSPEVATPDPATAETEERKAEPDVVPTEGIPDASGAAGTATPSDPEPQPRPANGRARATAATAAAAKSRPANGAA